MAQKIMYGLDGLKDIVKDKNIFLVHGNSYNDLPIKKYFDEIPHIDFSGFKPNPTYEEVCSGIDLFNENECNLIISIGGGSAIDVAKCIKLFSRMDKGTNYLLQDKFDSMIPHIAIPTTAGTGSESTKHAVIYYEGKKQSISHESIIPDIAILIESSLEKLPIYQKKCAMLDALCQAIESWWSVNSTEESIGYSKIAIEAIISNWKEYIFEYNSEAGKKILEAANYAGRAINITATTAAHAMSYKITSLYKFPHGHAVAISLKEVWKYIINHIDLCIDSRGCEYLKNKLSDISELISLEMFEEILASLNMEYPKSNNRLEELDVLTKSVNLDRLKNTPINLDSDVIYHMYERIIK